MANPYHDACYLGSAVKLTQLPADSGFEVAFAGRSNAGKSSALNTIVRQKKLARTSKTPGRTQMINLFSFDEERRLVDLPGYGYAKVPLAMKEQWKKTLQAYLQERECLRGLIMLMDIRHPLTELDCAMLDWSVASQLPTHVLLTKADKLKRGAAKNTLLTVKKALQSSKEWVSVQLFSALTQQGLEEVTFYLNKWFELEKKPGL